MEKPEKPDFLRAMDTALRDLHDLVREDRWSSLYIDYENPVVERLWTDWTAPNGDEFRLNLHKIHPCERSKAHYHPHPWPAIFVLLNGNCEIATGVGDPNGKPPPKFGPIVLSRGSFYSMLRPNEWHWVRPLWTAVYTVMLSGKPFENAKKQQEKPKLRALRPEEAATLLKWYKDHSFVETSFGTGLALDF